MPIIEHLTDIDMYKFTMGQFILHRYPDVPVKFAFKCRTKNVRPADVVSEKELREELDHPRTLRFKESQLFYIANMTVSGRRMFMEDYIQFLRQYQLPEYSLQVVDGMFEAEFSDTWADSTYWETIFLSIFDELYYRNLVQQKGHKREAAYAEGIRRLEKKVALLCTRPELTFIDFGTRRRFSRRWHEFVIAFLITEIPNQFVGTSNVRLAMEYGLEPKGTNAHELSMVIAGTKFPHVEEIRRSHVQVVDEWYNEFGEALSVILPDTFGTDACLAMLTKEHAHACRGFRQDSGDPIMFGEKILQFYKQHGVDATKKLIVFSDGLDVDAMIRIYDHFHKRIQVTFGWGTNLTNDLGYKPLSLVVKAVEACGHGLVKLPDNLAKATGRPELIELYKKIFGYTGATYEECTY